MAEKLQTISPIAERLASPDQVTYKAGAFSEFMPEPEGWRDIRNLVTAASYVTAVVHVMSDAQTMTEGRLEPVTFKDRYKAIFHPYEPGFSIDVGHVRETVPLTFAWDQRQRVSLMSGFFQLLYPSLTYDDLKYADPEHNAEPLTAWQLCQQPWESADLQNCQKTAQAIQIARAVWKRERDSFAVAMYKANSFGGRSPLRENTPIEPSFAGIAFPPAARKYAGELIEYYDEVIMNPQNLRVDSAK